MWTQPLTNIISSLLSLSARHTNSPQRTWTTGVRLVEGPSAQSTRCGTGRVRALWLSRYGLINIIELTHTRAGWKVCYVMVVFKSWNIILVSHHIPRTEICWILPSVRRELCNMIEGDRAASRPLCQSPVNVIPLINVLKTVNHCSPACWENHSIPSGW